MKKTIKSIIRHLILSALAIVWLIPIIWLFCTSFSAYPGINISKFFPEKWTLQNYRLLLFDTDTVAQFPNWFMNTLMIAVFTCIISSMFVLMVSYAISCMRFKMRKPFMNIAILFRITSYNVCYTKLLRRFSHKYLFIICIYDRCHERS